nr:unnamed protein product [Digitaria exilis]
MPPAAAPANDHVRELVLSPVWATECEGNSRIESEKAVRSYAEMVKKNTFEKVGKGAVDAEHVSSGDESSDGFDDLDCGYTPPAREEYAPSDKAVEMKQSEVLSFNRVLEGHAPLPAQQWNPNLYANATETEDNDACSFKYAQEVKCAILDGHSNLPETLDAEVNQLSLGHSNLLVQLFDSESCTEAKLIDVVKELSGRIKLMEKKQAWSNKEVKHLQGVNERLLKRIVELKGTVKTLNSKIDPLTLDDSLNQFVEQCLGSEDVIYLVGGFDGLSFLPSLDSFSPSLDILTPLRPMPVGKSYASTVALDGKIFVLGGGDGACWFDTVDCYDRSRDDWITCPALTHDKGSLAGDSVNGKIYAFGGGDGSQCFSDVDIFDPTHGKWIKNQPILEKRFALAGVALNGAIYAVGGFNGIQYLRWHPFPALRGTQEDFSVNFVMSVPSSAERLDPREANWKMLPMMSAGRGCHTLAVLNEKIFLIGGYDTRAKAMVSTVEVFEPRMPSWVMVEPMNYTRGYHSSAVLGGSIFTFGGGER